MEGTEILVIEGLFTIVIEHEVISDHKSVILAFQNCLLDFFLVQRIEVEVHGQELIENLHIDVILVGQ